METIMHSRDEASDSYRSKIIDVDANEPVAPAEADDDTVPEPRTFRERHALKVMGAVMAAMMATVIIAQVGC
jgi:hypothetical protein